MSTKFAPATAMKSTRIHCAAAESSCADPGRVEKPPVGIVENAYASAWYGVVTSSIPAAHRNRERERLEHGEPRVEQPELPARSSGSAPASAVISVPGSSDSMSWRPPTRSRGSTATARTSTAIPPSHCVYWRQIPSERFSAEKSVTTVAPVVVKPDMPSK